MEYRNKKTGIVIDIQSKLSGDDWELVETEGKAVKEEQQDIIPVAPTSSDSESVLEPEPELISEPDPDEPTGNVDIDSLKKEDIIQELEAMGIKHNPRDKKQVLYDLMMSQGK